MNDNERWKNMLSFLDWFFSPGPPIKPPKPRPPQLGYTVSQSEYDIVYKWFEEKRNELEQISNTLDDYKSLDSPNGEKDGPVQLARNARDMLIFDKKYIQQLQREQEQLTEQFDNERRTHRERENDLLTQIHKIMQERDVLKARVNKKKIPEIQEGE